MTDNPKTWGEMTPEEKGALLLARHEGKQIELYSRTDRVWGVVNMPGWCDGSAYRVKPEPKRETERLSGRFFDNGRWIFSTVPYSSDTHAITFDTLDGKPDCGSIRMEKIE